MDFLKIFTEKSIVYTSGTGAIFKSGIPIGRLKIKKTKENTEFNVEFFADFSQLKYVFAEIISKPQTQNLKQDNNNMKPIDAKLKILEDEKRIIEETNMKFQSENEILKTEINTLNSEILNFKKEILEQKENLNELNVDKEEIQFLRLNLRYGNKCQKTFFKPKGFTVGTPEYKNCVLRRGKKINE